MSDTPKILYKYRKWGDPFHQLIIKECEFYLSEPKFFEDSFDCNIPFELSGLNDKTIQQKYFQMSRIKNPKFSRQQHRQYARDWTKKRLMKDEKRIREIEKKYFDEFNNKAGILSLTEDPFNKDMWEYYGDNNKGFCIGMETEIVLNNLNVFGSCGKVHYYKELPLKSPFFEHTKGEPIFFDSYQKLIKWEFEDEYRVFQFKERPLDEADRRIRVPKESITEIFFGTDIPEKDKNEILSYRADYPRCQFYQLWSINGELDKLRI